MSVSLLLNRYTVIGVLQEDAYVSVIRAFDTATNYEVAIKLLSVARVPDPGAYRAIEEAFIRESEVGACTNGHPNIVAIYDRARDANHTLCLVAEYIVGGALPYSLRNGPLPLPRAVAISADIARGLQAAQQAGIVHTALTPVSIYLMPDGSAKVGDFGDAQIDNRPVPPLPTTDLAYRARYRSPEQVTGGSVTPQVDQFSLGVILFEMLFAAPYLTHDHAALNAMLASPPPPVAMLIERLTAAAPEARYPAMDAALTAILRVQESLGASVLLPNIAQLPPQPPPPVLTAARPVRRRAILARVASGIGIGAVGGVGAYLVRRRGERAISQTATPLPAGAAAPVFLLTTPQPVAAAIAPVIDTPVALPTTPLPVATAITPTILPSAPPPPVMATATAVTLPTDPPPVITATPIAPPTMPPPVVTATPVAPTATMPPPPTQTVAPVRTFPPQPMLAANAAVADMTDAGQWLIVSTPNVTAMLKNGTYTVQVAKKADGKGAIAWGDWVPKTIKLTPQFHTEVTMKLTGMPQTTAGGILFNFNYVPSDRRNEQQFLLFLARGDGRYALFQQFPGGSDQFKARLDYANAFPVKVDPDAPIVVSVEVRGKQLACAVNGQRVLALETPAEVATFSAVALAAQIQEGSTLPEISATFSNLRYESITP